MTPGEGWAGPPGSELRRREVEARRVARVEDLRARLAAILDPKPGEVSLELGCGHGHWLCSLAEAAPGACFVGVDLISRRVRLAEGKRRKRSLANVHFLKADADEILDAWPADRLLDAVHVLYPDPWPKKRHAKHRLTGRERLGRIAERLREGGRLYFRTDADALGEWTLGEIQATPGLEMVEGAAWPLGASTYFQEMLGLRWEIIAERRPIVRGPGP